MAADACRVDFRVAARAPATKTTKVRHTAAAITTLTTCALRDDGGGDGDGGGGDGGGGGCGCGFGFGERFVVEVAVVVVLRRLCVSVYLSFL